MIPLRRPAVPSTPSAGYPARTLDSADPEDAAHWAGVYRELKEAKQSLARQLEAGLKEASGAARAELESVDVVLIRFQLDRLSNAACITGQNESES
jgi:hypothetical protein